MRLLLATLAVAALSLSAGAAHAQKKYDPGASDTAIKIGQTMPYSGPASAYGAIGKAEAAYFAMINDKGGVNGRQIEFTSLDDGYSPPKAVEQARRLVEQDQVLLLFGPLGTPSNTAIQKYMNARKVPQLFVATGAAKWNDPKHFHWTMGWQPSYFTEGKIYAQHILEKKPGAKIAILYQNDDFGLDYVHGIKEGLGGKATSMIVKEVSYEVSDPTVDSQIVTLQGSGADTFMNIATPKFAAQAMRKAYDIGWKPLQYVTNVSASIGAVLVPAGLEKAVGVISSAYLMDSLDPEWGKTQALKDWTEWMKKYNPDGDLKDANNIFGYACAQTMVQVLQQAGDNLTRENIMKQAASLKDFTPTVIIPGIRINTSATDYAPIEAEQLVRFDGTSWVRFGKVMGE